MHLNFISLLPIQILLVKYELLKKKQNNKPPSKKFPETQCQYRGLLLLLLLKTWQPHHMAALCLGCERPQR